MSRLHRALALVPFAVLGAVASAQTFDLANDFSITNGNPNGVWTYGSTATGTFVPMTTSGISATVGPYWAAPDNGAIFKQTMADSAYGIARNQVSLDGDSTAPVARFTAPATGLYSVSLAMGGATNDSYGGGNGTLDLAGLRVKGVDRPFDTFSGNVKTWTIANLSLAQGETLEAYVGQRYGNANTQTKFTIVTAPVPEPASLAALGLGAAALLRRRRRARRA